MPKKTKKEKRLADIRRQHLPLSPSPVSYTLPSTSRASAASLPMQSKAETLLTKDLVKTVLWGSLIIAGQLGLYVSTR